MTLDTWLAFVAASTILLLIPGPTVMLVVGFALARGAARSWWAAFGVALGDATALGCSLLGLGAFLQASAELFTLLKWGGALYLVWIGLGMLRAKPKALHADGGGDSRSSLSMLAQAYVVTALNPKSIFFFVAFVPQFLTPGPDMAAQMLTVLCTFVPLAFLNAAAYAVLAGTARRAARRPGVMAAFNRVGGELHDRRGSVDGCQGELRGTGVAGLGWRGAACVTGPSGDAFEEHSRTARPRTPHPAGFACRRA